MKLSEDLILEYKQLIFKYHKTLDLISNKGLESLDQKIEDAKSYVNFINSLPKTEEIIDLGSGIGLPAIIMAIALAERNIHLVERRQRRVAFLKIVISQLELKNCSVHSEDIRILSQPKVSVITAQAVAPFHEVYTLTRTVHAANITIVSRKGTDDWASEVESLKQSYGEEIAVRETKGLSSHGSLVAVSLSGGLRCLP